jgi:hypothetical protein
MMIGVDDGKISIKKIKKRREKRKESGRRRI